MLSKKRKMPPVKVVFVPRFGSQLSGRDEEESKQQSSQRGKDGRGKKKCAKEEKLVLKVKLPKSKKASKEDEAPGRLMLEPTAKSTKSSESRGGGNKKKQVDEHGAGTQSDSVGGDVFFFPETPTSNVMNEKEKAKLSVVRTISRMLEENQLIRQRVAALSLIHSLH